ncbi:hypothetical protein NIES2100_14580 [Calothrix sp. NIES-2100]|uniref:hypothetical protein n=1 Tax=Calothrix sp. NIES-2100 TaxID=1954172 RepID=UPI000B607EB9|nr:hypothetical protein NIES2100_14580 [Calothrix sp. NIES-2100]
MTTDDSQKIVVEVPHSSGNFTPIPHAPQASGLEKFRQHWLEILSPPDNPADLAFDSLGTITITALITSFALFTPLPNFIRVIGWIFILIHALFLVQILRYIPEIRSIMFFRLSLVAIGIGIGS